MKSFQANRKFIKPLIFSLITICIFLVFFEYFLRLVGYKPHIKFQNIYLPYWVSKVDPVFLNDYKNRLKVLGKVNQDLYAYRPDSALGYSLKPNYKREIAGYSAAFSVKNMPRWTLISGKHGYRVGMLEEYVKIDRLAGRSIFVLGDSSSFGWGVNFEDTYGYILADIINRTLKPGEVTYQTINKALPGLSTFGGLNILSKMHSIKPDDWVLVSFGSNDYAPASMTDKQKSISLLSIPEKIHIQLERFLFFKMFRSLWVSSFVMFNDETKPIVNRVLIDEYSNNLTNIFKIIRSHGANPVFINICNLKKYTSIAKKLSEEKGVLFINFNKKVKSHLSEIPRRFPKMFIKYFDVYGYKMEENELYSVLFPDGCHPNIIGHQLIGEVIFEAIERKSGETMKTRRKAN